MSYRVDISTLTANEVYTLTFEYEGTETIQLIVGDLTLETTDRRVVFTTTSPVNYIESNMNLTNLNVYEGYYESDDFGGEYTQESIIEGKSLVNYHDFNRCILTLNNGTQGKWEFLDDGFARIRSRGDQALFGGNSTKDMKAKLGVKDNRPLADFLPTLTIAAKNLATEMTNYNVESKNLYGEPDITGEHVQNNTEIRKMLGERGIKPEELPPAEDIKKLERRTKSQDKKIIEKSGSFACIEENNE